MKGKKERIGVIKGANLIKKTRGVSRANFRTGTYLTEKDRPRDKNWQSWFADDITWCANSDECNMTNCYRNTVNQMDRFGLHSYAAFKNTVECPLYKEDK